MGHLQMGAPRELILKLIQAHPAPTFIETGTFMGGTTSWASKHFSKVITIEVNPAISKSTAERLGHPANVEFVVGDSAQVLPGMASRIKGPVVFWLDGHYCGPGTGADIEEWPIVEELNAAKRFESPIILIDDARCFLGPPLPPHNAKHWVNIDEIFRILLTDFPDNITTILDDVVVSVPRSLKPVLDEDWQSKFANRYPARDEGSRWLARLKGALRKLLAKSSNQ